MLRNILMGGLVLFALIAALAVYAVMVVRSKSELMKELQGLPVTKAVIYHNVDKKAWEQIAREHQ